MEDYPFLVEAISNVLERLCTDAGFSKRRLVAISGIDRVYLLQVEQGKYRLIINFMSLLAKGLGNSVSELVTHIEKEQKAQCQKHQN